MRTVAARRERPPGSLLWRRLARRCSALVQLYHAQDLYTLAALTDLAVYRRALRRVLQPSLLQCGDVQEYILRSIGRRNKTISLFGIEPLDRAAQFRTCPTRGTTGLLPFVHYALTLALATLSACPDLSVRKSSKPTSARPR